VGNKQKNLEKKIYFVGIMKVTEEKSRIRIRISVSGFVSQWCGSGSVPKCHGSTTQLKSVTGLDPFVGSARFSRKEIRDGILKHKFDKKLESFAHSQPQKI
jgi:hypothetical protein